MTPELQDWIEGIHESVSELRRLARELERGHFRYDEPHLVWEDYSLHMLTARLVARIPKPSESLKKKDHAKAYAVIKAECFAAADWLEAMLAGAEPKVSQILSNLVKSEIVKDDETEERDRWIYERCVAKVPYLTIIRELKKHLKWYPITTEAGIFRNAQRYAKRHGLPKPPLRKDG